MEVVNNTQTIEYLIRQYSIPRQLISFFITVIISVAYCVYVYSSKDKKLEGPEARPDCLETGARNPREAWKPGSLEAWKPGSLEAWKPGSLEAWKPGSLEAWKPGSLEAWKPGSLEAWKPGSLEAWKPGSLEAWKPGSLEAWKPGSLEAWKPGSLEAWKPGPIALNPLNLQNLPESPVSFQTKKSAPFSLIRHHKDAMKWIYPLTTICHVIRFLAIFINSTAVHFLYLATSILNIIITVFIKVEFALLIILSFLELIGLRQSQETMTKVIKGLHKFYWIWFLVPILIAITCLVTENQKTLQILWLIVDIEFFGTNGLLTISSIICLQNFFSISTSRFPNPNQKVIDKNLVFQITFILIVKLVYTAFLLITYDFKTGGFFQVEILNFDTLLIPSSMLSTYFVCYKPPRVKPHLQPGTATDKTDKKF